LGSIKRYLLGSKNRVGNGWTVSCDGTGRKLAHAASLIDSWTNYTLQKFLGLERGRLDFLIFRAKLEIELKWLEEIRKESEAIDWRVTTRQHTADEECKPGLPDVWGAESTKLYRK
jgi:hypothetical protein